MKKLITAICLGLCCLVASAQPAPFPGGKMNDEDFLQMQINEIVQELNLDKEIEKKFIKEYTDFRKEIDVIARSAKPPKEMKDVTEKEIDQAIQQNFAVSEKILAVRKKYYQRFRKFMQPSQIQQMYRVENEASRKMFFGPGAPAGPGMPSAPGNPPFPPPPPEGMKQAM